MTSPTYTVRGNGQRYSVYRAGRRVAGPYSLPVALAVAKDRESERRAK